MRKTTDPRMKGTVTLAQGASYSVARALTAPRAV